MYFINIIDRKKFTNCNYFIDTDKYAVKSKELMTEKTIFKVD